MFSGKEHDMAGQPKSSGGVSFGNPVEHIYHAWDEALAHTDAEALTALYAQDATIETPLAPVLMGLERPIRGREEIRSFWQKLAERKPWPRGHYCTGYMTDGKKLMWEYPRAAPSGDQIDFVEVMKLNDDGLIQNHRIQWAGSGSAS
jgi:hypothetical protein